ncbi:hypothetical protein OAL58_08495 [Verrucomicrobia bacterium]|nr:hypothetical protein [Verrucomicrobiota bacterium]
MKPSFTVIALPAARMRPWWLWPNVLSLDAPVVALVWQAAFAHVLGVELDWMQHGLLAVCVWLAYCGDRLLDARRLPTGSVDSARHTFARYHTGPLAAAWCGGLTLAVVMALQMSAREMLAGAGLLAAVGVYFLLHHWHTTREEAGRWKEPMAGLGFAVGVLFFVTLKLEITLPFVLAAVAWIGLCAMNCMVIAGRDRECDAAMAQPSMARRWTGMERALPWMALGWVVLVLYTAALDARWLPLALALVASVLALLELARRPELFSAEAHRVWADVVLLTPLFIFL